MSAQHTPGPWILEDNGCKFAILTKPSKEWDSATIAVLNVYRENIESDARLIAAAPELLRVCEIIKQKADSNPSYRGEIIGITGYELLCEAIAKATKEESK